MDHRSPSDDDAIQPERRRGVVVEVPVRRLRDIARVVALVERLPRPVPDGEPGRAPVGGVVCDLSEARSCDVGAVNALARAALAARRRGLHLWVRQPRAELRALVALAGLSDVLPVWPGDPPADGTADDPPAGGSAPP